MRSIQECLQDVTPISSYVSNDETINEGFKEWFSNVKKKFKQAWEYLKGIVVKLGVYVLPVDEQGEVMPAITPLTAGAAYAEGAIRTNNTCVVLDKKSARMVGLKTNYKDAEKLYGTGNSIAYWKKMVKECEELKGDEEMVNEVRLQNQDPQARYNVIVDNNKLKTRIKMALTNPNLARLMIWGAPGIGKTAILNSVLKEMRSDFPDYQLIVKTLSNETPDNFTLPKYVEVDGQEKAEDVPKTWLPVYKPTGDAKQDAMLDEKCGKGILFIDELSRATPQVLNVILPLVNEGVFNGYKLGSHWTIIVASNRMEDEMSGQAELGNALSNRFAQVYYEPTVNTWREWADKQNFISPLLLQWLSLPETENMSGGKYYYMDPNETIEDSNPTKLMCTPRSWTNAMRELAMYAHTGSLEGFSIFDIDRDIIAYTLNQYVPADAIDSFLAFLEVISQIGNFDEAVRSVWGGKDFKIDKKNLNKICLPLAQLLVTAHSDKLPTEEEFNNLATWLVKQGSDQLVSYVMDIFKSTYAGMISGEGQNGIFILKKKLTTDANSVIPTVFRNRGFASKWGLKDDLSDMPDYWKGMSTIGKKFAEIFKSAVVDDFKDALG